jgi:hypothetical protein
MPLESMKSLALSGEEFIVRERVDRGRRIKKFLLAESNYFSSPRSLSDRIRYFIASMLSYPDAAFGLLWNRARMEGYQVVDIREREDGMDIYFGKSGQKSN